MTVADWYGYYHKAPNARVLTGIRREAFIDLLVEAVTYYNQEEK